MDAWGIIEKFRDEMATAGHDEFDIEESIFWFAAQNHNGQSCPWYGVLSASKFRPSPLSNGPSNEVSDMLYWMLHAYAGGE